MKTLVRLTLRPIHILTVVLCVLFCNSASGQNSVTIDNIVSGTYAAGGNIGIEITPTGTFNSGNQYQIYLSDASGSFASQTLIGTYTGTYINSVNATLPASLAAGTGYKVKIVTTSPATQVIYSGTISVGTGTTVSASATATGTTVIQAGAVYGTCNTSVQSFSIINTSTSGANITYKLVNDLTGADATSYATYNASTKTWAFNVATIAYYTFTVTAELNGVISTATYTILRSKSNATLTTNGGQAGCMPNSIDLSFTMSELVENHPALLYQVQWGDGTVEYYSLDSLKKVNGKLTHIYTQTSCNQGNGYFTFQANPWAPSNWNFCVVNSQPVFTQIKVFLSPEAKVALSSPTVCVDSTIRIHSNSLTGQGNYSGTDVCEGKALFTWILDGNIEYSSSVAEEAPPDLVKKFTTSGLHAVQLIVSNNPCGESDTTVTFCVTDRPDSLFTININKSCVPFTVKTDTTYNGKFYCSGYTQKWEVVDSNKAATVSTSAYTVVGGSMSGSEPQIKFITPGKYYIKYTVTNACTSYSAYKLVEAIYANVTMPTAKRYCAVPTTLNFQTNTNHKPTYSTTAAGSESYAWTITGSGTYSFENGTTAASAYPIIKFNTLGVYTVTVTFSNLCGSQTASQQITFDQPVTTSISNPSTDTVKLCYGTATLPLTATYTGPTGTIITWATISPTNGTFSSTNTVSTTYTLGTNEKSSSIGKVTVIVTPPSGSACFNAKDTTVIVIYPENKGTDYSKDVCSGTTLKDSLTSTITSSTFTVAVTSSSNITGASGTIVGNKIVDKLVNTSSTTAGTVVYTVTPYSNSCAGTPFKITVTVQPTPALTVNPLIASVCTNNSIDLQLTSSLSGSIFQWRALPVSGTASGYFTSQQSTTPGGTVYHVTDKLINTTTSDAVVQYVLKLISNNGCASDSVLQNVTVHPTVSNANAGSDQKLCQATSITITGNTPGVGTGVWKQTLGPAASITTPNNATTTVTGLLDDKEYRFAWVITDNANSCGYTSDTVYIYNRPAVTQATVTSPIILCDFVAGDAAHNSVVLTGNVITRGEESGVWSVISQPASSTFAFSNAGVNSSTFTVSKSGHYVLRWTIAGDAGCTPTTADLDIYVFDKPAPGLITGAPSQVCAGRDVSMTLTSYTGTIQKWQYSLNGGTSWKDTAVTADNITFLSAQDTFYVRAIVVSNGVAMGCNSKDSTVPVIINVPAPTVAGHTSDHDSVCINNNFGTINLSNNVGAVLRWESSINNGASWVNIGNANATSINYNNLSQTTWYRAVVQNGACLVQISDSVVIKVKGTTTVASISGSTTLCNAASTTLTGTTPVAGQETGTWVKVSGPTTVTLSSLTAPVLTLTPGAGNTQLTPGNYVFSYTIDNGVCGTSVANATVRVSTSASGGTTGTDTVYCIGDATGTVFLSGSVGTVSSWEYSEDGTNWNTISNSNNTNSLPYTDLQRTTYYRAALTNGSCTTPAKSTITIITVKDKVTVANAGADQDLCNVASATITGNAYTAIENGAWSQSVKNAAGAVITSPASVSSGITGLASGKTYTFIWTISNGGTCPNKADSLSIVVRSPLTNGIDLTHDTICSGITVNVTGDLPTGGNGAYTYQWQYSYDNISWNDFSTLATAKDFSFVATQSIYVRRKVSSSPCETYSNVLEIPVKAPITNNTISANQVICINTTPTVIDGSVPSGGGYTYIYAWEQSVDNGTTWTAMAATTEDLDPGVLTQTTQYRRTVATQYCFGLLKSVSNVVVITVNPDAKAVFSVAKAVACAPFNIDNTNVVDTPYLSNNSGFQWLADGVQIGSTAQFPGYTIVNQDDSVVIRLVAISKFGCKNDSMEVKFYSFPKPDPLFLPSVDSSCGPLIVHFTNNSQNSPRIEYTWDLGNGTTTTDFDPVDVTYPINPDRSDTFYVVKLTAKTDCDTKTYVDTIKVYAAPKATFTPSATAGCSPLTVFFNNNSLGERVTYTWNFDDGNGDSVTTSAGQTSHTFITYVQDTFHVRLVVTNSCGSDTMYYNIVVSPNPISLNMSINGDQREGCAPLTVQFDNNTRGANAFRWDFGDGNVLNTTNNIDTITHVFATPGTYTITLIASNLCSDTTGYESVTVLAVPEVDFTAFPTELCIGDSIHFTNNSNSTLTGLVWRFNDGDTSVVTNPDHAYKAANTYNVTLTGSIKYQSGVTCSTTATHPVTVIASLPGSFTVSDTVGNCVPYTITFTNDGPAAALNTWDFGDGSTATGDKVTHTYTQNGTFTVKLNALDPGGCTYLASRDIVIQGPQGQFTYDYGYICKDKAVRLEVAAVRTTRYKYIFGDGDTLVTTDNVVYHIYKQSGIYIPAVQLLTDVCGVWIYGTNQVMVDYYKVGFTAAQQKVCGNSLVAFTDTSRSYFGIQTWEWNFGDGAISTDRNPQHSYVGTNSWPVQLIITGLSGCKDTVINYVAVKPNNKPVAQIMAATGGCTNQSMMFTANVNSQDSVSLYAWNFSNGFATNGEQISTKFGTSGAYQVQLVAGTIFGCYDTARATFVINPTPVVSLGNDLTICRGASAQLSVAGATEAAWSPINDLDCGNCLNPVATPLETRQYVAKGSNVYGCSSTDTIVINVIQPARVQVSGPDTICVGQSAQLYADGVDKYRWWPTASLSNSTIASPVATPTLTTIYSVEGSDSFNCFRDTGYITVTVGQWPKLSLGPDKVLSTGTEVLLTSTYINGPMVKWTWTPEANLSCSDCAVPVATVRTDVCYTAKAENIYGCWATDTVCIQAFCESTQVFIPNAFVPGSVNNGLLMVRGKGIRSVKSFRVYNRWGQVVFERANFQPNDKAFGWDGTIKGSTPTPDVYVYTCEVICDDGKAFTYKGNVAILK